MSNNVDIEAIKREGLIVLGKFHRKMKPKKSGENKFGGFSFYTDKDIRDEFYKTAQELGIEDATYSTSMDIPTPELIDYKVSRTKFFYKGVLVHETCDFSKMDYIRNSKNDSNQHCGATSTYAAKYSLKLMFNIPSEELDPDGEESSENPNSNSLVDEIKNLAKIKNVAIEQILKFEKLKSLNDAKEEQLKKILNNLRSLNESN